MPSKADVDSILKQSPLSVMLEMSCVAIDAENASLSLAMPLTQMARHTNGADQFHGGAIATLIDTAACFAVWLTGAQQTPTLNLRVDYLRAATGGPLVAHAKAVHRGKSTALADVEIHDASKTLIAVGRCSVGARA